MIGDLNQKFIQLKDGKTGNTNELIHQLKRAYMQGEVDIKDYREMYRELNQQKIVKQE